MIDEVARPLKRQREQNKSRIDSKFSLGPVKFEASVEHPSENTHG